MSFINLKPQSVEAEGRDGEVTLKEGMPLQLVNKLFHSVCSLVV